MSFPLWLPTDPELSTACKAADLEPSILLLFCSATREVAIKMASRSLTPNLLSFLHVTY